MRHEKILKEQAKSLRSKGLTYSEIKQRIKFDIPKSTLSNWCSKINLPYWYQKKVDNLNFRNFNKARQMAWVANKIKQEKILQNLWDQNSHILKRLNDKDLLKMLLAMLYLGEGAKWQSARGLTLGSSDPNIVRIYLHLLKKCFYILPNQLHCRISYRADQNIEELKKYWSRITEIPLGNFYKTKPDPRTVGKPTKKKEYKGVCVISGGGTKIQLELETIPKLILEGL